LLRNDALTSAITTAALDTMHLVQHDVIYKTGNT